jgi:methylthioribose-1-phosphate isomerase
VGDTVIAPENVPVYNPAFDVTPHRYLTGIVTEEGICYPPFTQSLRRAKEAAEARIRAQRAPRAKRDQTV